LGVLLFSGSIYLPYDLTTFDFKIIGFVTPIGGGLLIAAWCVLVYQNWVKNYKNKKFKYYLKYISIFANKLNHSIIIS
jgi:hypothetical protein